jgi:hypothetical protein
LEKNGLQSGPGDRVPHFLSSIGTYRPISDQADFPVRLGGAARQRGVSKERLTRASMMSGCCDAQAGWNQNKIRAFIALSPFAVGLDLPK